MLILQTVLTKVLRQNNINTKILKKTTFLLGLCTISVLGQTPRSLTDYVNAGLEEKDISKKTTRALATSRSESNTTLMFDSIDDFLDNCTNSSSLIFEDFEGGPTDSITQCGPSVSSLGDSCYAADEIQEGVEFTTNRPEQNAPIVHFNGQSFGVFDPSVGPDVFPDFLVINFSEELNVKSVAFDLYSALGDGALTDVRLFGEDGFIENFIYDAPQDDFVFVGLISTDRIVRIEIENLDGVIENVAQFYFGNCEENLGTEDTVFSDLTLYPNPAQNTIIVTSSTEIQTVSIFNLLGQRVLLDSGTGTSSQIDVSNLSSGGYLVNVSSTNGSKTLKLLID